eukprot:ANDGO_08553.mRNA.1 Protein CARMIL
MGLRFPTLSVASRLRAGPNVSLALQGIGDRGLHALSAAVLSSRVLKSLDLRENGITAEGVAHLAHALISRAELQESEGNGTWENEDGSGGQENGDNADESASFARFESLDLSGNILGEQAAEHIAAILASVSSLKTLKLAGCKLGDRSLRALGHALTDASALTFLDLSDNGFSTVSSPVLSRIIAQNITLQHVDLSWNSLRDAGASGVLSGLKSNGSVKSFAIRWNGLADASAALVSEVLANASEGFTHLDISHNRISGEGASKIAAGLKENKGLHTFLASDNPFGDHGGAQILQAIKTHPTCDFVAIERIGAGKETELLAFECQQERHVEIRFP